MYTYILADYTDTGENEIHILKGYDIVSALRDYCEENEIFFINDSNNLYSILRSISIQTDHRINIIKNY